MKKFYGVCSSYYDNGKVIANLVDVVEHEEKPQDTYKCTRRCDIYVNWFDTEDQAMQFVEECRIA